MLGTSHFRHEYRVKGRLEPTRTWHITHAFQPNRVWSIGSGNYADLLLSERVDGGLSQFFGASVRKNRTNSS